MQIWRGNHRVRAHCAEGMLTAVSVEMLLLLESISQPGSGKEQQSGETPTISLEVLRILANINECGFHLTG